MAGRRWQGATTKEVPLRTFEEEQRSPAAFRHGEAPYQSGDSPLGPSWCRPRPWLPWWDGSRDRTSHGRVDSVPLQTSTVSSCDRPASPLLDTIISVDEQS